MSRTAYKYSAVIVSLLVSAMLTACGSDHREANANPASVARVADEAVCRTCHAATLDPVSGTPIVADFITATNSHNQPTDALDGSPLGCQGCHGGGAEHNGVGPIPFPNPLTANRCITCHTAGGLADTTQNLAPLFELAKASFITNNCSHCHTASGVGSIHGAMVPTTDDCVFCHEVSAPNHGASLVNDNSGVRAIVPEFRKTSHHIFNGAGVDPAKEQCAVCHLEGLKTAAGTYGGVDQTVHMADGKVHLRNCNTTLVGNQDRATNDGVTFGAGAQYMWDPAAPDHQAMDQFCFSCHNAAGAASAFTISNSTSPMNPFNDLVTTTANGYDKQGRPGGVVAVFEQFTPTNFSHHGVRGKRYITRSTATAIANGTTNSLTVAGQATPALTGFYASTQQTLFGGGLMTADYTPLGAAATVGDDSTLHCGDCHTVGQWRAVDVGTKYNQAVIGAHGSTNEYMLRNNVGTDQIHGLSSFVCFNCHNDKAAGDIRGGYYASAFWNQTSSWRAVNSGSAAGVGFFKVHINSLHTSAVGSTTFFRWPNTLKADGSFVFVDHGKPYESSGCIGSSAGIPFTSYTGSVHYIISSTTIGVVGRTNFDNGNITGIGCINCHNSGRTGFGGIHGSNATYTTGWSFATATPLPAPPQYPSPTTNTGYASTQSVYRFMPGMGNYGYVPPNPGFINTTTVGRRSVGVTGKAAWEWNGGATVAGGCYTNNAPNGMVLNGNTNAAINGGDNIQWSGCNHHSADRRDIGGAMRNTTSGNIGRTLFY